MSKAIKNAKIADNIKPINASSKVTKACFNKMFFSFNKELIICDGTGKMYKGISNSRPTISQIIITIEKLITGYIHVFFKDIHLFLLGIKKDKVHYLTLSKIHKHSLTPYDGPNRQVQRV